MAQCIQCGEREGQRDGLCGACRLSALVRARRKYQWTEELREQLRAAYRLPKLARVQAIGRIAERTKWPRKIVANEAHRLGLPTRHTKPWTPDEEEYLDQAAGRVSVRQIAKRLRRSHEAIEGKLHRMGVSRRDRQEGYSACDLAEVFGVGYGTAAGWVRRGLLGKAHGSRVKDEAVLRFIREYPHEYDLRMVDQVWFKSVIFAKAAA